MAFWHRKKKKQDSRQEEEVLQGQKPSQEVAEGAGSDEQKRLSEKELAAEHVIPKGKAEQKRL